MPRSVSEARQAIAEHEGQVNSVISEWSLNSEASRLVESASRFPPHRLDVRSVTVTVHSEQLSHCTSDQLWDELSCSALPVALPFYLRELRKVGA